MKQAYKVATKQSLQRKTTDVNYQNCKTLRGTVLLPWDCALVWNLSKRGETGKERKYTIFIRKLWRWPSFIQSQNKNNINSKTQYLHLNLLLRCDQLLNNFNWNISQEGNKLKSTSRSNKLLKDGQNSARKLPQEEEHNIKKEKSDDNEESSSN